MTKYHVVLRWEKFIAFPEIEAEDEYDAEVIANQMLAERKDLIEEDGKAKWEIKKIKI